MSGYAKKQGGNVQGETSKGSVQGEMSYILIDNLYSTKQTLVDKKLNKNNNRLGELSC